LYNTFATPRTTPRPLDGPQGEHRSVPRQRDRTMVDGYRCVVVSVNGGAARLLIRSWFFSTGDAARGHFCWPQPALLPRRFLPQEAALQGPKSPGHPLSAPLVVANRGRVHLRSGCLAASCRIRALPSGGRASVLRLPFCGGSLSMRSLSGGSASCVHPAPLPGPLVAAPQVCACLLAAMFPAYSLPRHVLRDPTPRA